MKVIFKKIYSFLRNVTAGLGLSKIKWLVNADYAFRTFLRGNPKESVFKHGVHFTLDPRGYLGEVIRPYELESTKLLYELKPGDVFVDIGASIGWFTCIAAKLGCKTISFEPEPNSFALLKKNISDNNLSVEAFNKAVSDKPGTAKFYTIGTAWYWSNFKKPDQEEIERNFSDKEDKTIHEYNVETVRLDDVISKADFIKIDVEHIVDPVFDGMQNTLKKNQNVKLLIEEPSERIVKSLGAMGYKHKKVDRGLNIFFWK